MRDELPFALCSVFPLMRESLGVLMQRAPVSLDYTLPAGLQKVGGASGGQID